MQSNKFLNIAKDIARKNRPLFDTLLEFERTKKIRTKMRLNFSIDKSTAQRFRRFCREKRYNMSAKIEQAMKEFIEKDK